MRLRNTLFLAGSAAAIAVPLAMILGITAAFPQRPVRQAGESPGLAAISLPEFFVGYLLILVLRSQLGWLPSLATCRSDAWASGERLKAIALPAVTLVLVVLGHMMRMTRAAILNVMQSAYIETAELKGLPPSRVIRSTPSPTRSRRSSTSSCSTSPISSSASSWSR